MSSVLTIKTRNEINPNDFQIRSGKVRQALEWLIENNPLYHDVQLSEENLESLPDDGNVYDLVNGYQDTADNQQKLIMIKLMKVFK